MSTSRRFETFFSMSSGRRKRDKPSLYEQEHGPLQMFGPANGVSNYLGLEKVHCMLILRIRVFWPLEL